jgi:hypothetical protein
MVNCDHREILRGAHRLSRAGAGQRRMWWLGGRVFPLEPLLRSAPMFNPVATNGTKYLEPLPALWGTTVRVNP